MNTRFLLLSVALLTASFTAFAAPVSDYLPMKVIQTDSVIYPRAAKDLGIKSGEAHVTIQIDESGKLSDYVVTAYTYRAFADAVVNALKRWRFEPAFLHGIAYSATADLTFDFENEGVAVVDLNVGSYVEMRNFQLHPKAYEYRACTMRQLDRIPTPTTVVKPVFPPNLTGTVAVQFFIDEKGHVRMPAVSRETGQLNQVLSAAAVEAVSQWKFEPPLSKGRPVLVAARQEFNFTGSK